MKKLLLSILSVAFIASCSHHNKSDDYDGTRGACKHKGDKHAAMLEKFSVTDVDANGELTIEEFEAFIPECHRQNYTVEEKFTRFDDNQDGVVTVEEIEIFFKNHHKKH